MFVCHCRAVTDCTIRSAIEAGASDLRSLAASCGAGTRCGGCHFALYQLIAEIDAADRVEVTTPLASTRSDRADRAA